eukprot:1152826-Pelagomonas_calceolata.AAC.3
MHAPQVSSEPFLDLSLPIPSTHKPPPPPKDTASSNSSRTGSDAQRSGLKKKKERATGSEATTLVDDALAVGKKGKKDKQPQQQQQQQQQQLAVSDGKKALPLKVSLLLVASLSAEALRVSSSATCVGHGLRMKCNTEHVFWGRSFCKASALCPAGVEHLGCGLTGVQIMCLGAQP